MTRRKDNTRQLKLLGQSAILEEAQTPYLIRLSMLIICFAVLAFIAWASISRIKEMARTVGEIVPSGHVQIVQHLEGGIVKSIEVKDDQLVEKGQILMQISGEHIHAEHERVKTRQRILEERRNRLLSYITSTTELKPENVSPITVTKDQQQILDGMLQSHQMEKSVIEQQIIQKNEHISLLQQEQKTEQKNLKIAEASFKTQQELYDERLVPENIYLNALQEKNARSGRLAAIVIEIRQAEQAVREYQWRLKATGSNTRDSAFQEIGVLENEMAENDSTLSRLYKQSERLALKSPVKGVVKGMEVHTVGGVIAPGQRLMEIVPLDNELVAEVKVLPVDIGHIGIGDPVNVKITSYDSSRYGSIDGTVTGLSATTFSEAQGQPYYKGQVKLSKSYVGDVEGINKILPGMIVNADIITGEKSILAYLLKPIHLSMQSAFAER